MQRPVLVIPPAILPVTLAEAKAHLRVDHSDEDALIEGLIAAATDHLDGWDGVLGRALVEQTWRQDFDAFGPFLLLPLAPVISITSVGYTDAEGSPATVDSGSYALKTDEGGRPYIAFDGVSVSGPVSVTYVAGYATIPEVPAVEPGPGNPPDPPGSPAIPAQATVPAAIKAAILLLVGHWYEHREAVNPGPMATVPMAVDALIAPYRRVGV